MEGELGEPTSNVGRITKNVPRSTCVLRKFVNPWNVLQRNLSFSPVLPFSTTQTLFVRRPYVPIMSNDEKRKNGSPLPVPSMDRKRTIDESMQSPDEDRSLGDRCASTNQSAANGECKFWLYSLYLRTKMKAQNL